MFPRSVIDDSRSINDTSRVVRMTNLSGRHSDDSKGVIYKRNIFMIQATSVGVIKLFSLLLTGLCWEPFTAESNVCG